MTRKVLSLEKEVTNLKKVNTSEGMKVFGNLESVKGNEIDVKTDISEENSFNPTSSSSPKHRDTSPEQMVKKESQEKWEDVYSCTKCEYEAKKEAILQKHIVRNVKRSYHHSWSC